MPRDDIIITIVPACTLLVSTMYHATATVGERCTCCVISYVMQRGRGPDDPPCQIEFNVNRRTQRERFTLRAPRSLDLAEKHRTRPLLSAIAQHSDPIYLVW